MSHRRRVPDLMVGVAVCPGVEGCMQGPGGSSMRMHSGRPSPLMLGKVQL